MAATRSRLSPDLAAAVRAALAGRLARGGRLCIALSGGRDSVALLDAASLVAADTGIALSALHVHHGLSPNADRWAAFCAALCDRLGVPLRTVRVVVRPQSGEGVEAAARRVRYEAFAAVDADAIALAHHAGDQAETLLFRLVRGSGVIGAAAMPTRRNIGTGGRSLLLLRPLLALQPVRIDAWIAARRLSHIDDESNGDTAFSRNFLRHSLLPPLEARFPGAGGRLAAAAGRFREAADLLDALADIDIAVCAGGRGLRLDRLRALPEPRQRNLLHGWLRRAGLGVRSDAWLAELLAQVASAAADSAARVVLGNCSVRCWRGELMLTDDARIAPEAPLDWRGEPRLPWAGGEVVFAAGRGSGIAPAIVAGGKLQLRPRAGGERLQPDPRRPRRSLKNLWQEAAVPPWERDLAPCLWHGDELVWVGGVGVDAACAAAAGEVAWLPSWHPASRGP